MYVYVESCCARCDKSNQMEGEMSSHRLILTVFRPDRDMVVRALCLVIHVDKFPVQYIILSVASILCSQDGLPCSSEYDPFD